MWCPSVSLSVWANAWLAGAAAPDDVLDALSQWAPRHSVTAYDSVAAGRTGLPWPDLNDAGAVSLLQTVRTAAGPRLTAPAIGVALPVPGDVRGLPAGTQFQRDAVTAGEALIVAQFRHIGRQNRGGHMGAVDLDVGHGNQLRKSPAPQRSIRIKSIWCRLRYGMCLGIHIRLNAIPYRARAKGLRDQSSGLAHHVSAHPQIIECKAEFGSPGWIRTSDHPINSRMLYR